ncbi:MAG: inositol monophosphatase family protein [Phycisphaerae bacterium]
MFKLHHVLYDPCMSSLQEYRTFLRELVEVAMLRASIPVNEQEIERKPDTTYVTSTDKAIQQTLLDAIHTKYPEHAVIGEESESERARNAAPVPTASARYCWVIDPLDGTRNYVSGLPCFSTSIALLEDGVPVLAAIGEPNLQRVFFAEKGKGADRNDRRMAARDPHLDRSALVGLTTNRDPQSIQFLENWAREGGFILRNLGSTAYHMALVADGALHGCASRKCKIWDIAAGVLLIEEAGGHATHEDGRPLVPFDLAADPEDNIPVIAGAPQTHERLIKLRGA